MRIGVDVDDVLLDTLKTAWLPTFNKLTCHELKPEDITSWNISDFVRPNYKQFIYEVLSFNELWDKVLPVKDSQNYLKIINNHKDIELYIVSASNPLTNQRKWDRFFKFFPFINTKQMILIQNKQLLKLDILIDDNYNNLKDGDVLFAQPHNLNDYYTKDKNVSKLDNWEDIYNYIIKRKDLNK